MKRMEPQRTIFRYTLVLCISFYLLIGAIGSAIASAKTIDPVDAFEPLLLELHVQGERLSDVLVTAFASDENGSTDVLLPMEHLAELLGLNRAADRLNGDDRDVAPTDDVAYVDGKGLTYVSSSRVPDMYGLDVHIDIGAAVLTVETEQSLPLIERMRREQQWQRLPAQRRPGRSPGFTGGTDDGRDDGTEPDSVLHNFRQSVSQALPYSFVELNAVDYEAKFRARTTSNAGMNDANVTLRASAAGELLYMTALVDVEVDEREGPMLNRFTLQRVESEPVLFGPLGARQIALWDVVHGGLPLVAPATPGRGVTVSNMSPGRAAAYGAVDLIGPLHDGWDVELYRNGVLIDYRRADGSGRYSFDDVLLYYGDNDLRLVFHGPRGEVLHEEYNYPVSESLIPEGESQYQLSIGQDALERERAVVRYGRALSADVSADVGAARVPVGNDMSTFLTLGLQALGPSWSAQAQAAMNGSVGRALDVGWRTRWGNTHVALQQRLLWGFESASVRPRLDPLAGRTTVSLQGIPRSRSGARWPMGAEVQYSVAESGRDDWRISHRVGTVVGDVGITNWLTWSDSVGLTLSNDPGSTLEGRVALHRRRAGSAITYDVTYGVHPALRIRTVAIGVEHPLTDGTRLRFGMGLESTSSSALAGMYFSAGAQKDVGPITFNTNWSYDARGEYRIDASLATGGVRRPSAGTGQPVAEADRGPDGMADVKRGFVPVAFGATRSGAAAVSVFIDDNANGNLDPGERRLNDIMVLVDRMPYGTRTDDGVAVLSGLPLYDGSVFEIDESELPDVFWSALGRGTVVALRPGKVALVELPVVVRGEVFGTAYLAAGAGPGNLGGDSAGRSGVRAVSGVELQLVDGEGRVVGETVSGYGGFYIFSDVVPGSYVVRIGPDQARRLGLHPTGVDVQSADDGSGHDIVLQLDRD